MKVGTKEIIDRYPNLKNGYYVCVDGQCPYGDQIAIRWAGGLWWRDFEFSDGFNEALEKNLKELSVD
ncbi:hypothetical protein FYL99_RS26410 [Escherichia coli]|nr:hypothetical protein [Escherichia coli]